MVRTSNFLLFSAPVAVLTGAHAATSKAQPNIVVYMTEDLSPRQGFAGDDLAETPHLDKFAKRAVHLSNVFSVYGVCAPSRSSFQTMRYPFTYGAHNMRTSYFVNMPNGSDYLTVPPPEIKAFPELLRQSGYWTWSGPKCDLQFCGNCGTAPESIWTAWGPDNDLAFWRQKASGDNRPFMGQLGDMQTHESRIFPKNRKVEAVNISEVAKRVVIPDFYKDTETMRTDLAWWYNNINIMDSHFGEVVQNLEDDGLIDDTIVIWMSDHGDGLPRGKRDVFDWGTHVPSLWLIPEKYKPDGWPAAGSTLDQMVSFIDYGPSLLDLAGVAVPQGIHGKSLFSGEPRGEYVFGGKDRMDEAVDHVRYVRSKSGFKLIRNFRPELPAGGRVSYRYKQPGASELRELFQNGTLNEVQSRWFLPRHPEEFYNLNNDPLELDNLINTTKHTNILAELRAALDAELEKVGPDLGFVDEAVLAQQYWPDGVQPVTPDPVVHIQANPKKVRLTAQAEGSSLLYALQGCGQDSEWLVYGEPVPLGSCSGVKAKAQRYGWSVSNTISQSVTLLV